MGIGRTIVICHRDSIAYIYNGWARMVIMSFSPFSLFAAVSLCGVAGLAQTFPSLTVSGPFLLDTPRLSLLTVSFHINLGLPLYRALPLHLHFDNCSDVLGFVFSFDMAKPLQPSPSHNRLYLFHFRFLHPHCPSHHSHLGC